MTGLSPIISENWYEESGLATCTIDDPMIGVFVGIAKTHPEDEDMKSQKTGAIIAAHRARIKYLKAIKTQYLRPQIELLERIIKQFNHSSTFNPKCRENKIVQRELQRLKYDLVLLEETIVDETKNLKDFIENKEEFYQRIRKTRKRP